MTCTVRQTWINSVIHRMSTVQSVGTMTASHHLRAWTELSLEQQRHLVHTWTYTLLNLVGWSCWLVDWHAIVSLSRLWLFCSTQDKATVKDYIGNEIKSTCIWTQFVHMNMLLCWLAAKLILNYSLKFLSLPSRCCCYCCCCHLSPRLTCCHFQKEAPVVQKRQCFPSPYCLWECRVIKTWRKNKMFLSH